jgi:hypothetical protein
MPRSIIPKDEKPAYEVKVDFQNMFKEFTTSCDLFEDKTVQPIDAIAELKRLGKKRLEQRLFRASVSEKKGEKGDEDTLLEQLGDLLEVAAKQLPGCYRENYVQPLRRHLASVQNLSPGTVETLTAAIYDHLNSGMESELRGFLALISNVYRSFLQPERLPLADFPQPQSSLPALATFRRKLDLNATPPYLDFAPFTLPTDEVERICGAKVAVVSLPSCYRKHPVLSWAAVAHEAGGHDVLHAYPGLLPELRQGVRELFYQGPDPHMGKLESREQFLGLLWQHWTEETASDVYAVMNLGPCYGIALAVYFAALSARFRKHYRLPGEDLATLPISSRFDDKYVDYHSTKILSLYAVMGAIQALSAFSENKKSGYLDAIESQCSHVCLSGNTKLIEIGKEKGLPSLLFEHYDRTSVRIRGYIRLKAGCWIDMDNSQYILGIDAMCEHARRVGYYIATAKLRSLNGHSIQDLETWDDADEQVARNVQKNINENDLHVLGDDAQLFAGALLALCTNPSKYKPINKKLSNALEQSFWDDDIWGNKLWHPIANQESEKAIPDQLRTEMPHSF